MNRSIVLLSLGLVAAAHALAAPIYRCGADGRTYSQVPCAEGSIVEATDPRTAAQRAEATRFVAAERQRAAEQERERKAAAKPAAGASAASAADTGQAGPKSRSDTKGKKINPPDNVAAAAPAPVAASASKAVSPKKGK